jgi:hypothetical protein
MLLGVYSSIYWECVAPRMPMVKNNCMVPKAGHFEIRSRNRVWLTTKILK